MRGVVELGLASMCAGSLCGCATVFGLDDPARARGDAGVIDTTPDTTFDAAHAAQDAAPDGPPPCPSTYTLTIASSTTRYRLVVTSANFLAHHASCKADQAGRTHLASLDTLVEIDELRAMMGSATAYIGGVQMPDQATPDVGWITFNGGPLPARWISAPDDAGGGEDNEQNVAVLAAAGTGDRTATEVNLGLCECDGIPVAAAAESAVPMP